MSVFRESFYCQGKYESLGSGNQRKEKTECFVNITERFFENLIFAFANFLRFDISLDLTKNFLLIFVMNG